MHVDLGLPVKVNQHPALPHQMSILSETSSARTEPRNGEILSNCLALAHKMTLEEVASLFSPQRNIPAY